MDAHFNFWRIAGDKDFKGRQEHPPRDFMEIGLLVTHPSSIDCIKVFLPTSVDEHHIEDAGALLSSASIAQGIFNEKLNCVSISTPERIDLTYNDSTFCRVHKFIKTNNIIDNSHLSRDIISCGTIISVTKSAINSVCHKMTSDERVYFRLRIFFEPNQNPFIHVIRPADRRFQSGFDEIEYIDFRFNELRTLPPPVENHIRSDQNNGFVPIRLVAFLTAFPVHSDISSSSGEYHKTRLLENDLWDSYVPSGIPGGMVVYHWKKESTDANGVVDFSSYVKLHTRRSGNKILATYLLVAFLFGLLGNLAASGIVWWCSPAQEVTLKIDMNPPTRSNQEEVPR